MARIPYPDPGKHDERYSKAMGDNPPNVSRMMGHASPGVLKGFMVFSKGILIDSPLSPKLRELAILRVGYLSNAKYETYQHESLGRHVGLTEAEIDAIRAGDCESGALDERQCAVLRFVDDITLNVRPSDETLAGVRKHLNDTELTDLVIASGFYMMVSRFLETTGVEIDEQAIDWSAYPKDE